MSVTVEPGAPGTGSPGDQGVTREGSSGDHRTVTHDALDEQAAPNTRGQDPESLAVVASRRLCPYLTIDGGAWRSAVADRDHRCGALTPMPPLTLDKQRRLCLTDRHLTCATYLAARGVDAAEPSGAGSERPIVAVGPGRSEDLDTVTRWSIVRTAPVILDRNRIPGVGTLPRGRAAGQLGLAVLLVAAFAALAVGRLGAPSSPAVVGAGQSPRPTASAQVIAAASPATSPEASPTSAPTPAGTPRPSKSPAATATPSPSTSTAPSTTTYKVRNGDTLYGISIRFHTSVKAIQQLNHLSGTTLHIGQVLKIPS